MYFFTGELIVYIFTSMAIMRAGLNSLELLFESH